MSDIILYMAPGTCARVPCILLEESGAVFETRVLRFMRGEHKSPDYRRINPRGKVPALQIDGANLAENVAIITYLVQRYPDAALMPHAPDALAMAQQLADVSYCASTLHPVVTRIRLPGFFAGEDAARSVWEKGCAAMDEHFQLINTRLADTPWWYGEQWSAMDAYLYWIFWRVSGAGYSVDDYPHYQAHSKRMEDRPAVQRALAREKAAEDILAGEGLLFTPPPVS